MWLNYKNAYEYWNEQRLALNKEVQHATQHVLDKLPNESGNVAGSSSGIGVHPAASTASAATTTGASSPATTLFLQLTVEDLGICLPMMSYSKVTGFFFILYCIGFLYVANSQKLNAPSVCRIYPNPIFATNSYTVAVLVDVLFPYFFPTYIP